MSFKNTLRFLLLPALITTLGVAGFNLLIRWVLDISSIELNEGVMNGWIPLILAVLGYFVIIHHRFIIFFKEIHRGVVGLIALVIAMIALQGFSVQALLDDYHWKQHEINSLAEIDQSQKNIVWKFNDSFSPNKYTYLADYQEYTSGKHPKIEYLSYGVVHFEQDDIWILCSESESISQSASDAEKTEVFNQMRDNCWKQIQNLSSNTPKTHYLIPLHESEDLQYAYQTLIDLDYNNTLPKRIFSIQPTFKLGLTEPHFWLLSISIGPYFLIFLLVSLFGRKNIAYNDERMGVMNLSFLLIVAQYVKQVPITCLIIAITIAFLIVEILHDPNIMSVKSDPYLLKWSISKEVWRTHEWHRFLTYPFTNFHLMNKILDPLLFAIFAYNIETRLSKFHFLLLLIVAQLAGGLAAAAFNSPINCGLTVYTIAIAGCYLFTGFQRKIGFSQWKFIGITLLIFGLFLGALTEFVEYQKLIAATLVGFLFGPFLKLNTK